MASVGNERDPRLTLQYEFQGVDWSAASTSLATWVLGLRSQELSEVSFSRRSGGKRSDVAVIATCCERARGEHCEPERSPVHPLSLLGPPNTGHKLRAPSVPSREARQGARQLHALVGRLAHETYPLRLS
jgi:hypothetical protein